MKKIITFVLCLSMTIGVLSGCVQEKPIETVEPVETLEPVESTSPVESTEPTETIEPVETTEPTEVTDPFEPTESTLKGNTFDEKLVNYINEKELGKDNYVMSPLSFKMALSLLIEGAEGETLEEVLNVLDVESVEELRELTLKYFEKSENIINESKTDLQFMRQESYNLENYNLPALMISNSVWKNKSEPGEIVEDYKKIIEEYYKGTSATLDADKMKETINQWTAEKTNNMIPSIVDDSVAGMNTVLVNAIYIKDSWFESFAKEMTEKGIFKAIDGSETEKEFMQNTESYKYYEDEETKLVVIPTTYGFDVVYVIGSRDNIEEKLAKAEYVRTHVRIPKLDIESSLDNGILVDFLKTIGVKKSFTSDAEFSKMCTFPIKVSDIIQKAKIKTDEDGIEGAAVTAIMMETCGVIVEPEEIKEFNANEPFSFYVKLKDVSSELKEQDSTIFYGQVVR